MKRRKPWKSLQLSAGLRVLVCKMVPALPSSFIRGVSSLVIHLLSMNVTHPREAARVSRACGSAHSSHGGTCARASTRGPQVKVKKIHYRSAGSLFKRRYSFVISGRIKGGTRERAGGQAVPGRGARWPSDAWAFPPAIGEGRVPAMASAASWAAHT